MIKEIDDYNDMVGEGILAIDDNSQYPTFQFEDDAKKGWKNFAPKLAGELQQAILEQNTSVTLHPYFTDSNNGRVTKTNIEIDLSERTQQGKKNKEPFVLYG